MLLMSCCLFITVSLMKILIANVYKIPHPIYLHPQVSAAIPQVCRKWGGSGCRIPASSATRRISCGQLWMRRPKASDTRQILVDLLNTMLKSLQPAALLNKIEHICLALQTRTGTFATGPFHSHSSRPIAQQNVSPFNR